MTKTPVCSKCSRAILPGYEEEKGGGLSGPWHGSCPTLPDLEKLQGLILRDRFGQILHRTVLVDAMDLEALLHEYRAALHVIGEVAGDGPGLCLCVGENCNEAEDGKQCRTARRVLP